MRLNLGGVPLKSLRTFRQQIESVRLYLRMNILLLTVDISFQICTVIVIVIDKNSQKNLLETSHLFYAACKLVYSEDPANRNRLENVTISDVLHIR
jgi:hypothetical protein